MRKEWKKRKMCIVGGTKINEIGFIMSNNFKKTHKSSNLQQREYMRKVAAKDTKDYSLP
jgi:hypothetical protein